MPQHRTTAQQQRAFDGHQGMTVFFKNKDITASDIESDPNFDNVCPALSAIRQEYPSIPVNLFIQKEVAIPFHEASSEFGWRVMALVEAVDNVLSTKE